jgi:rhodanese-related sulfurtransferase
MLIKYIINRIFGLKTNNDVLLIEALKSSPKLIDVRTSEEFKSGSVNGSINIPLGNLSSRLDDFHKNEKIVVFCRSGSRSEMAKNLLVKAGFSDVTNGGPWQNVQKSLDAIK